MNAEFLGDWDVATRSHPNDGRADVTHCPGSFGLRDRIEARRRLPVGAHLPHPALDTSVVTQRRPRRIEFSHRLTVFVDGVPVGKARTIEVTVRADAALVYV
jgi:hypothetical protein